MNLALLMAAGLAEIAFAVSMKLADGFSKIAPTAATVVFGALSFILLGLALKGMPLGPTYAVWTGMGIAGATVVGIFVLGDHLSWQQLAAIALVAVGVVVLSLYETRV